MDKLQKRATRQRSKRLTPLDGKKCTKCGATERLQRHHPDYSSDECIIVCQTCHTAIHVADGTWGRGAGRVWDCVICGKVHGKQKTKTCSAACASELGRLNARKRWDKIQKK